MIYRELPGRTATILCSSACLDLIAASHVVINPSHHAFAEGFCKKVSTVLDRDSLEAMNTLRELPLGCLELSGLAGLADDLNDTAALLELVEEMSLAEFAFWLLQGKVPLAALADHFGGKPLPDNMLRCLGGITSLSASWTQQAINAPGRYRDATSIFWRRLEPLLLEHHASLQPTYERCADVMAAKFQASDDPVSEGISLVGSDGGDLPQGFGVQYLIVSWFASPHRVHWADLQRAFVVPDWREVCVGDEHDRAKSLGTIVSALADTNRLIIMRELCRGPAAGRSLAPRLGLTPATTSHHLDVLVSAGLVSRETVGSAHLYATDLGAVDAAVREIRSYLSYGPSLGK
jgi:DNA-binding transcriptional ArsR family regulator